MKKYVASVRDTEGRMTVLRMEYNTKKEFKSDIKANGYTINYSYIFTEEEYDKFINEDAEFMAWFIERLEKRKRNSKLSNAIRRLRKAQAKEDAERLEQLKAEIQAEKEAKVEVEPVVEEVAVEVETAVEENRGIKILKESIAERKANGGDASGLERLLKAVIEDLETKRKIEASLGEDVGLKEGVRFEVDYHITEIDGGGNVCSRIATDVVRTWESVMWYKINTRYCGVRIIS